MTPADLGFSRTACAAAVWRGTVAADRLPTIAAGFKAAGAQLYALWGSDRRATGGGYAIHAVFMGVDGLTWVCADLPAGDPAYPDLSAHFRQAGRMQRATFDLLGIRAKGAADTRKWLRHGAWPADVFPLRHDFDPAQSFEPTVDAYPFITVEGDGVHEIPVGPVHAGTIEPGHFRFSIIGDRVLKLEQRLGYKHKGIEKLFQGRSLADGVRLAGRVSGDSHVAYSWAYSMAAEMAAGCRPPLRALWLRALWLEMERIANHLGDLGYLGNDVALTFVFNQCWLLKEDWLRLQAELFGHRYLFDLVVPGGVARDLAPGAGERLRRECARLQEEVQRLKDVYVHHAGVQDRMRTTGRITPPQGADVGLVGMAGRASRQCWDARCQGPCAPYDTLAPRMVTRGDGDVISRAAVRFAEVFESVRLIGEILDRMPAGELAAPLPRAPAGAEGIGWVEGWRGGVLVALETGADGRLARCHPHDPSWLNWPVLELAILGNIVPDFPLINKSFNLSYSGQDL